jgi:cytochrome c oxidase subunit 3
MRQHHPYHLVDASPWPFLMSVSVLVMALGLVLSFHRYQNSTLIFSLGLLLVIYIFFLWSRDIMRESRLHYHTTKVQTGLQMGMVFFIMSEAMFFVGLLWAFIHAASQPSIYLGTQWPPAGIIPVEWNGRPLLNTALLFASYFSANVARYAMEENKKNLAFTNLLITVLLGFLFTFYQYLEYSTAAFTFSDSVFGSVFYLTTGFHGFHVIVGVLFLLVCLLRLKEFSVNHSVGLKLAVLYWHFVDIVWIFLMGIIYYWGSYKKHF